MKIQSSMSTFEANFRTNETKIPRPMNCFMTYRLEKQREIIERCPGANHRDISKIIAKWWKELPAEEKEGYRRKAEMAKLEHNRLYPNYKFCPKRKVARTRAYKKRPNNQFTARDYEDECRLYTLYHGGKDALPKSTEEENYPMILDVKEVKSTSKYSKQQKMKEAVSVEQSVYPGSDASFSEQPNYNTSMLYPPTIPLAYANSVPSQAVYSPMTSPYTVGNSPSPSPYTSGYYSSSEEPNQQDVNYNLYPTHYGYASVPPAYTYCHDANTGSPTIQYYTPPMDYTKAQSPVYDNQICHPLESYQQNQYLNSASPSLLTSSFYYQQQ